jgi:diguanylate cyclase (GGDEF)-like protein
MDYITLDVQTMFFLLNICHFVMLIMLFSYGLSTQFDNSLKYYTIGKFCQLIGYIVISLSGGVQGGYLNILGQSLQFSGFALDIYCIIFIGKKPERLFSILFFSFSLFYTAIFLISGIFIGVLRIAPSIFVTILFLTGGSILLFYNNKTGLRKFSGIFLLLMTFPHFLIFADLIFRYFDYFLINQDFTQSIFFLFSFIQTIVSVMIFLLLHNEVSYLELKETASKDFLTGIYNRKEFFELSNVILNIMIRQKNPVSLLMLDLDKFKKINDTYGHQTGDKVIVNFVRAVEKVLRKQDVFGRYGGEEFIIFLPNTNKKEALMVAERIRSEVEKSSEYEKNIPQITVSIGVNGLNSSDINSINGIIKSADEALYKAKQNGRNRVETA